MEHYLYFYSIITILLYTMFMSLTVLSLTDINIIYKIVSLFVIILVIFVSSNKKTFLPFLGPTVFPPSLFNFNLIPNGDLEKVELYLNAVDGTRIIYWGSLQDDNVKNNPIDAYGDYSNTGIAEIKNNKATLYYNYPSNYKVGTFVNKVLEKHIHYRLVYPNNPMISPVYTKKV